MDEETRSLLETLPDLRVVDLKRELEKRKLPKSGSKKELCERLRSFLKSEEPKSKVAEKNADAISSLNLPSADAGMENNEFVKSYLEQREKLLERQMEQKKKYQEEAYKSQESESQSEAEDLTQHGQQEAAKQPRSTDAHQEPVKQQDPDATLEQSMDVSHEVADLDATEECKETSLAVAVEEQPEYNSETDEDTEDESGNYSSGSPGNVMEDKGKEEVPEEKDETSDVANLAMHPAPCEDATKKDDFEENEPAQSPEQGPECASDVQAADESIKEKAVEEPVEQHAEVDKESIEAVADDAAPAAESEDSESIVSESDEGAAASGAAEAVADSAESDDVVMEEGVENDKAEEDREEAKHDDADVDADEDERSETSEVQNLKQSGDNSKSGQVAEEPKSPTSFVAMEEPLEVTVLKDDEFDEVKATDGATRESAGTSSRASEQEEGTTGEEAASKKLIRAAEEGADDAPVEKPARKRKWGSVELESQSVTISSDSFKGLIPDVMLDLSVPCDMMMDVIGNEDSEVDTRTRVHRKHTTDAGDEGRMRRATTSSSTGGAAAAPSKLGRTIYQEVGDVPAIPEADKSPADVENEKHRERRVVERKISRDAEAPERTVVVQERKNSEGDRLNSDVDVASKRRRVNPVLQPVDEPVAVERGRREMTPPRNPVSRFIHIFNLVRPYTLHQLKEILQRTGTLVETGFWIDKIKSHCIAEYETCEQAVASREALHGKKWPACNPKILRVDFSDENELEMKRSAKEGTLALQRQKSDRTTAQGVVGAAAVLAATAAAAADVAKVTEVPARPEEARKPPRDVGKQHERQKERDIAGRRREEPERRKEDDRRMERPAQPPIREWDKNKVRPSLEREADASVFRRKRDSGGHFDEVEAKRHKRSGVENEMPPKKSQREEPPAKLLDDLFRKTKATPCIYWLPLTEEQIAEKERRSQKVEPERMQKQRDRRVEDEREERARNRVAAQREREGDRRRDF